MNKTNTNHIEDFIYYQQDKVIQQEKELQKQIQIFIKMIDIIKKFIKKGEINGESIEECKNGQNIIFDLKCIQTR